MTARDSLLLLFAALAGRYGPEPVYGYTQKMITVYSHVYLVSVKQVMAKSRERSLSLPPPFQIFVK